MATVNANSDGMATGVSLHSKSCNYKLLSYLGQGTSGKVAKCMRLDSKMIVAVKMMKNKGMLTNLAKNEIAALRKLEKLDSDKCNLVKWTDGFVYKGHTYLEFEHLDKSLYDLMVERRFKPLHLKEIRPIVHQVANALDHLKSIGMIHADLKLQNVMLVNHLQQPYSVKVIDFGLACDISDVMTGSCIQSRAYRAPEIILGIPHTEAVDMWSLGCIVAYLYVGALLFPGSSEYDTMRYMLQTLGQPPDNILSSGQKTRNFFERQYNSTTSLWKLKSPENFWRVTRMEPKESRKFRFGCLDHILHFQPRIFTNENTADRVAETIDVRMFVDMLKKMFQFDASKRLTPCQVLEHQFTSMKHFEQFYSDSSHVKSSFEMMAVCQSKTPRSDTGKSVFSSSSSRAAYPAQLIHRPTVMKSSFDHYIYPHPSSRAQVLNCIQSQEKRRINVIVNKSQSSNPFERVTTGTAEYEPRQDSTRLPQVSCPVRSHPAQLPHQSMNYHPSNSIQIDVKQGIKRKVVDSEDMLFGETNSLQKGAVSRST